MKHVLAALNCMREFAFGLLLRSFIREEDTLMRARALGQFRI